MIRNEGVQNTMGVSIYHTGGVQFSINTMNEN
jgi:hypothetical protein